MRRGRDEAGNIWEIDDAGNPVRMIQAAQAPSAPGSLAPSLAPSRGMIVSAPPDPYKAASEARAQAADAREQQAAADAHARFVKEQSAGDIPTVGDPNATGKALFDSLPKSYQGTVRQLLSNHLVLSSFAMAKPYYQAAIDAATRVDPSYDPSLAPMRAAALKAFTGTGPGSISVGAVNRLAANLKELKSISDKMGGPNTGIAPLNRAIAGTEQEFEPRLKARYDALLPEIATQFDLVMKGQKGSGATVSGIAEAMKTLDRARSQDERNGAFQEIVRAVHGAIQPIKDQWDAAYGGTKAPPMWISKDAGDFFASVDPENAGTYGGNDWRGLPGLHGDALPWELTAFGSGPPSGGPPAGGGSAPPPTLGGGPKPPGGLGGPGSSLATMDPNSKLGVFKQTYRNEYDPDTSAGLNALIHKGAPIEQANAYLTGRGFDPIGDPGTYRAAVSYAQDHPDYMAAQATKSVPTTVMQRLASSPAAAALAGGAAGATAGFSDTLGRSLVGPEWDANRAALAGVHPVADALGNVGGGLASAIAAPELLAKYAPGALAVASKVGTTLGKFAAPAGDLAYGATYGANESPDNVLGGAAEGGLTGLIAGQVGRSATRGLANMIAPPEGAFGPAYAQGVFPTIGQRFGRSGFPGRAINTAEQAMQSMPGLGAMVARARDIPRDAAQLGAFNESLGELKPFDALLPQPISALPAGTQPGPGPHIFAKQAFDQAYPIARAGMQLVPGEDYTKATQDFAAKWFPLLNSEQKNQLSNLIRSSVTSRLKAGGGMLDGTAYQQAASDVGGAARAWSRSDPLLAQAAGEYGGVLDNAARASSDPQAVALLHAADRGYAKYAVVRNAAKRPGGEDPGEFTMKALDRAVQGNSAGPDNSQYLRGNAPLQDYSRAIQPLGDVLSNSGTGERLLTNRLFMGEQGAAGVGGLGALALGAHVAPGALAPFSLYAPGANKVITRAIAPRQFTLPPAIADALNLTGSKVNGLAPLIGAGSVPLALTYYGGPQ